VAQILRYHDPVIKISEGKFKVHIRLSFKTIYFHARYPLYDRALPRICQAIKDADNEVFLIDVGANIGDTALQISEKISGCSMLCIEGNEEVIPFLKRNTRKIKNNKIFYDFRFCVDDSQNNDFAVKMEHGTAHLVKNHTGQVKVSTLDDMITDNPIFKKVNLLKIDTDGFEITVLNGAKKTLENQRPILFFEFTPSAYIENGQETR